MSKKKKRLNSRVTPAPKTDSTKKNNNTDIFRIAVEQLINEQQNKISVSEIIKPYRPPSYVVPEGGEKHSHQLANDGAYTNMQYVIDGAIGYNGVVFKGYPHYAQLYNMPEFRKIIEVMSTEMTRKWIELKYTGDDEEVKDDISEKINKIKKELSRLNVQTRFGELIAHNFIYGRGQLYINLKMPKGTGLVLDDPMELKAALSLSKTKIPEDGIVSLNLIEPIQTTAAALNTIDPLKEDYYQPTTWYVAGKEVHKDRLITLITNEVATFLKPAFNYGGLSLLQLVEPTVNNWLTVRDSGKDLVKGSNVFALKTDMQTLLASGDCSPDDLVRAATDLNYRAKLFTKIKSTNGVMLLDYEKEELSNINVSMAGIAEMITKYQEQPSQVTGIPVVKLTGNTPSGLNASSEGEIQVFYDMIAALKEAYIREPLQYIINIVQISLFGVVDDSITFDFIPMQELTEKEKAEIEAIETATLGELVDRGVVADTEARTILKNNGNPAYASLEDIEREEDEKEPENPEDKFD
ncbi:hypothetical protein DES39_0541 [Orbus hercynius]|uniref:Anti-CBASS protein Acb1-like N-terminal domain-containing protein n=1 Tax=Orbus hercynius TaxID=593135 RepID=A0A495RIT1_9GAMM|nr:DUF1073 domain-containing protein [Orbus hercynius]RKS87321.1 hypothetical protein DES39_0541 [Orbus hercynius]